MTALEHLTQACQRLGAQPAQAQTMAAQLLKRAEQLSAERGSTREAELARLLEIVVQGRAGNVAKGFVPPTPPPAAEG